MKQLSEGARMMQAQYMRQWRAKNRERINDYNRKWRAANPERVREYNSRYWEKKAGGAIVITTK